MEKSESVICAVCGHDAVTEYWYAVHLQTIHGAPKAAADMKA